MDKYLIDILLLGLPALWDRHRVRSPCHMSNCLKPIGPRPQGGATEDQKSARCPKRGKGTRKSRQGR